MLSGREPRFIVRNDLRGLGDYGTVGLDLVLSILLGFFGGRWLDGDTHAAQNVRFRGENRWGPVRWSTTCHIETCRRPETFSYRARHWSGATTRWTYELVSDAAGTVMHERYESVDSPAIVLLLDRLTGRPRRLQRGMSTTLARLSAAAEQQRAR